MQRRDLVTGVATFLVGAGASYDARHLAWFSVSNVPGPGFLPRSMSFLLCLLGLLLCVSALRSTPATAIVPSADRTGSADSAHSDDDPETSERSLRGLVVLTCFAGGCVLVRYAGFLVAMIAMILVILFLVERRRSLWAVVVAVAIPVSAYLLFTQFFAIQLPLGPVTT
jgi:hypothetical protein